MKLVYNRKNQPDTWKDLGGMLHTNLRKSMDGPLSVVLWNFLYEINPAVWTAYLKFIDGLIKNPVKCSECRGSQKRLEKDPNSKKFITVDCWCMTIEGCVRSASVHFLEKVGYQMKDRNRRHAIILCNILELFTDEDWAAFTNFVKNVYEGDS